MADEAQRHSIKVVLFDFGGVLAEKGFEGGLMAIAARHGLDATHFYHLALDLIHATGYLTGRADEGAFWQAMREGAGIGDDDVTLRNEILSRFVLRPWMFDCVRWLKAKGVGVAILSDQTNWLDELNELHDFFKDFDVVFNSYHLGKSKVDPSHFSDTVRRLGRPPQSLLFVDDSEDHCRRARSRGLNVIHFRDRDSFFQEMELFFSRKQLPDSRSP